MDEEGNLCCICQKVITRGTSVVPFYFCSEHYKEWRAAAEAKTPWITYLINLEKQRRKKRNRRLNARTKGQ